MNYYHPDFFGVQEAVPQQMVDVKNGMKNYDFVGFFLARLGVIFCYGFLYPKW